MKDTITPVYQYPDKYSIHTSHICKTYLIAKDVEADAASAIKEIGC